jgi:thiol-disulfide isomerase/thioredoxin
MTSSLGARATIAMVMLMLFMRSATARPEFGDVPPDAIGVNAEGETVKVSDLRGKVVVAVFWASWCSVCRAELPVLEQIQRQAGRDELEVVAINWKESKRELRAMRRRLRDYQMTFTHDPEGVVGDAYGVTAVPHLVMIDRGGALAFRATGYSEKSNAPIVARVNELLAEPRE